MNQTSERWMPFVLAVAAPLIFFILRRFSSFSPSEATLQTVTESVLNLSGILVGFLATAKALLFALPDRRAVQIFKESHGFEGLVTLLFSDIAVWLLSAITSLILMFVMDWKTVSLSDKQNAVGLWLYFPAAGLLSMWRSMRIFSKVLKTASRTA